MKKAYETWESRMALVARFQRAARRMSRFLTNEQISDWAQRTADLYIERGEVAIATPLPFPAEEGLPAR